MSLAGEGVVAIWHDIVPEGRDDFLAWHTHEHMPERVGIPGFVRGRRYVAECGAPEFFNLYEAVSVETLGGQDYLNRLDNPTPLTMRAVRHFRNVARSIQRVRHSAGPGIGGHLMTLQLAADDPDAFLEALAPRVLAPLASRYGITGVHLCQTDAAVSAIVTKEKAAREGDTAVPQLTLMVEGVAAETLIAAQSAWFAADVLKACGASAEVGVALYRLEYIRNRTAFS